MLRRLTIAGIVFFWLLMNGALVKLWLYPATSEILTVPVGYVSKLLFLHEQPSALTIYQNNRRAGNLSIQPRRDDNTGLRIIEFTGALLLKLPMLDEQSFNWAGTATLDRASKLRHLTVTIDTHDPALSTKLDVDPPRGVAHYALSRSGKTFLEKKLTLDEQGARSVLHDLGINPDLLAQLGTASSPGATTLTAHQSAVTVRGERVEAFHVIMRQNSTPLFEADVSQFGQVLSVNTAIGFTLALDDVAP